MTDQWTSAELFAELRSFEAALREAGLQPNTVQTYVGRSDTFIRWLVGDYTPRGPNMAPTPPATEGAGLPRGEEALRELRDTMRIEDLKRYVRDYAAVAGYDAALREFRSTTGPSLDLGNRYHALALLHWLRRWGCRHLRKEDAEYSADALQSWWGQWVSSLPSREANMTTGIRAMSDVAVAYGSLASTHAAHRRYGEREVDVRMGDTAAAKTLFALRPAIFPPWDEPIRLAFAAPAFDGGSYARFLRLAADALDGAARRFGVEVHSLPDVLERPSSTPAKLVDEYLWTRITRNLGPSSDGDSLG